MAPPIVPDFGFFWKMYISGIVSFLVGILSVLYIFGNFLGLGVFAVDGKWLWASNGRILNSFRAI